MYTRSGASGHGHLIVYPCPPPLQLSHIAVAFRDPSRILCEIYEHYGLRTVVAVDPLELALLDVRKTAVVPEGWVLRRTELAPGLVEIEITDPNVHGSSESRPLGDPGGAAVLELEFDLIQPGLSSVELRDIDLCRLGLFGGTDLCRDERATVSESLRRDHPG